MTNHDNDIESDSDEVIPLSDRGNEDGRTVITERHKEVMKRTGNEAGLALVKLILELERRRDDDGRRDGADQ